MNPRAQKAIAQERAPGRPADNLELVRTDCVICGKNDSRTICSFRPADLAREFSLEQCPHCGAAFVNPHPTKGQMLSFFSDSRIFLKTTDPEGRRRSLLKERDRRRKEFAGYVRRIKRLVPDGRALDVGCGLGLFLELLGPNYDRLGLDVNPFSVRFIRERLGLEVMEDDAMETEFAPESFDLISVMQTLDHLDRPGVFLDRAANWLRPGGVLFLSSLINIDSFCARLFKDEFRLLHPFHLTYFTPSSIRKALEGLGFRIVRLEYPYFRTPYFSPAEAVFSMIKMARRLVRPRTQNPKPAYSPAFIGNVMNVYAVKGGRS